LIGTRTPDETFRQRTEEATRAIDYTPEERAIMQRQMADRARFDAERYSPEQQQREALTRFLLGGAGRSGIGSIMAGAGAASENYQASMRDSDRARLLDRQKQESGIVDVGPAARMAGMKLGSEGERTAMTGLAQGTGDAVRLEQIQAAAGRAGAGPDEFKRLSVAEIRFDNARKQILSQMKERSMEPGSPESAPYYQQINQIGKSIYERMQIPDLFVPDPVPGSPVAPPPSSGNRLFGSGTVQRGQGGAAPRAVPFSALPN
jgi:hypothetical protein